MSGGDESIIVAALNGDHDLDVEATAIRTRMPKKDIGTRPSVASDIELVLVGSHLLDGIGEASRVCHGEELLRVVALNRATHSGGWSHLKLERLCIERANGARPSTVVCDGTRGILHSISTLEERNRNNGRTTRFVIMGSMASGARKGELRT